MALVAGASDAGEDRQPKAAVLRAQIARAAGSPTSSIPDADLTARRALHERRFTLERVSAEDVDLGKTAESLAMSDDEQARACDRIARVQRFRLLRADGKVVGGPGRLSDRVSTQILTDAERVERLMSRIAADGHAVGSGAPDGRPIAFNSAV